MEYGGKAFTVREPEGTFSLSASIPTWAERNQRHLKGGPVNRFHDAIN